MSATQNSGDYWADMRVVCASRTFRLLFGMVRVVNLPISEFKRTFLILGRCIYVRGRDYKGSYKKFREWLIRHLEWLLFVLLMIQR